MRLVVTGGGTGGHVFPALEVALTAVDSGADVVYFGSHRGQERSACAKAGVAFVGFPSEPIYRLKSIGGVKAVFKLGVATLKARTALKRAAPNVVFSTGGYASAPVVRAAKMVGIRYVLHEQNCVPGRSNRIAANAAYAVATTFHGAAVRFPGCNVVRTGLPVRRELRQAAMERRLMDSAPHTILAVGGSQGAAALNEAVLACAARIGSGCRWIHVTGKAHFESIFPSYEKLGLGAIYRMKSFLEGAEMASAYAEASLVVGRSGAGTLSELAAFGLPAVLVPYPHAHADHQMHNAREFESIGAASVIPQADLTAAALEERLRAWISTPSARDSAREALAAWDIPDAAVKIYTLLEEAATSR